MHIIRWSYKKFLAVITVKILCRISINYGIYALIIFNNGRGNIKWFQCYTCDRSVVAHEGLWQKRPRDINDHHKTHGGNKPYSFVYLKCKYIYIDSVCWVDDYEKFVHKNTLKIPVPMFENVSHSKWLHNFDLNEPNVKDIQLHF